MSYTMEDFERDYLKEHFTRLKPEERREILQSLSPEEQRAALEGLPPERLREVLRLLEAQERRQVLRSLPPEDLLAGLSAEQIRQYLDQLTAGSPPEPPKPRRKK